MCHAGVEARAYHAGLKDAVRGQVLRDWSGGIVPVVVATVAFGMGIDRASTSQCAARNPARNTTYDATDNTHMSASAPHGDESDSDTSMLPTGFHTARYATDAPG